MMDAGESVTLATTIGRPIILGELVIPAVAEGKRVLEGASSGIAVERSCIASGSRRY